MEFLRKSLEGIADIRHPAIESLENQIALLSVPKGIEQDIQARVTKLGLNTPETPEEEETASRIENLMSEHHKLIQAENAAEVHRKQLEGQEKFIAGLVFQREQLKRTPVEQQVHAAFRAQNITDVESPNAHQIRANIEAIETQKKEIQARNQALADAAALYNATRTPLERYNDELTKLDTLLEQGGNLSWSPLFPGWYWQ